MCVTNLRLKKIQPPHEHEYVNYDHDSGYAEEGEEGEENEFISGIGRQYHIL